MNVQSGSVANPQFGGEQQPSYHFGSEFLATGQPGQSQAAYQSGDGALRMSELADPQFEGEAMAGVEFDEAPQPHFPSGGQASSSTFDNDLTLSAQFDDPMSFESDHQWIADSFQSNQPQTNLQSEVATSFQSQQLSTYEFEAPESLQPQLPEQSVSTFEFETLGSLPAELPREPEQQANSQSEALASPQSEPAVQTPPQVKPKRVEIKLIVRTKEKVLAEQRANFPSGGSNPNFQFGGPSTDAKFQFGSGEALAGLPSVPVQAEQSTGQLEDSGSTCSELQGEQSAPQVEVSGSTCSEPQLEGDGEIFADLPRSESPVQAEPPVAAEEPLQAEETLHFEEPIQSEPLQAQQLPAEQLQPEPPVQSKPAHFQFDSQAFAGADFHFGSEALTGANLGLKGIDEKELADLPIQAPAQSNPAPTTFQFGGESSVQFGSEQLSTFAFGIETVHGVPAYVDEPQLPAPVADGTFVGEADFDALVEPPRRVKTPVIDEFERDLALVKTNAKLKAKEWSEECKSKNPVFLES